MLSFLEIHEVLVGFVNFKLYYSIGLTYPPKFSEELVQQGDELDAIQDETKQIIGNALSDSGELLKKISETDEAKEKQKEESKSRLATLSMALNKLKEPAGSSTDESIDESGPDNSDEEDGPDNSKEDDEVDELFENDEVNKRRREETVYENLFAKCHFWLSREVPKESLEFAIKSFGGRVSWESAGKEDDESITHHIVDRDQLLGQRVLSRDYVQPQWVYDCINARILIPTEEYQPGAKIPPHLSPFVDDYAEGYIPDNRKNLD